jgi:hypothetical protein
VDLLALPLPGPDEDEAVRLSVSRAKDFLLQQARTRTPYRASLIVPDDPTVDWRSSGPWRGTYSLPSAPDGPPYTPILIKGPLHFPIAAQRFVTFHGSVDLPFVSMEGIATNWPSYYVVGSVRGIKQFIARVNSNATFEASLVIPPPGQWSFQLATYANAADAGLDRNRTAVGHPWLEAERPGDVRDYYATTYWLGPPLFTGVVLSTSGGVSTITGTLATFTNEKQYSYGIFVTSEVDVEYAWALVAATPGPFSIERPRPFSGRIKLRLLELENGCARRVVGQMWAEENAVASASAWPDLRIEYRSIGDRVPAAATRIVPACKDGTWEIERLSPGVGRVSLVDVNTKRIYGEYTMPSGLLRSFNVPAVQAGQTPDDVYYDGFNDACFLYDQAVALIAFLQLGERESAQRLLDALCAVQNKDGSFPFANDQSVLCEHNNSFIRIGTVAWVCYALLLADRPSFRGWFPTRTAEVARRCLAFLSTYLNPLGLVNGGKGRYIGTVLDAEYIVPWWSTEHNIDTWWCFDLAAELYGDATYRRIADNIRAALETEGWNEHAGIFWQGGAYAGGANVPDGQHALDVMSWGAVVLDRWGRTLDTNAAIGRMCRLYYVTDAATGLSGFTTFIPADGYPLGTIPSLWYEGSFGAAFAMRIQDPAQANRLMALLATGQNPDGSYPYALHEDPINDINTFPSLVSAVWDVLAYSGPGTSYPRTLWI